MVEIAGNLYSVIIVEYFLLAESVNDLIIKALFKEYL